MRPAILCVGVITLLFATQASALSPTDVPSAVTRTVKTGLGPDVDLAANAWLSALRRKPTLVSLKSTAGRGLTDQLKDRLQKLGSKTFSNREWRAFWVKQDTTATAVADALKKLGPRTQPSVAAFGAWASLARDKVENQDRYLEAVETERDALEERLEATLEGEAVEKAPPPAATLPSPYERRKLHLEDLRRRADWQKRKRRLVEMDLNLIGRQLKSEEILLAALRKDVDLARRERDIATGQAKRLEAGDFMQSTWAQLSMEAAEKVKTLQTELRSNAARKRAREVELGLAQSQMRFRDKRIAQLVKQREVDGGFATWLDATGQTLLDWAVHEAWRIILGLLAIWIGLQLAIYVVRRTVRIIVQRAEGDPDDPSDDDTRILTLANVFSGVAKMAVWIIAALLALETIGVNTGPLLGSVAILGLAISFGSQNLVRDVVNGFFILMEHQYAVGEVVDLGGKVGTVEKITIRSTWIRQMNGSLHVVPNGGISVVSNLTRDWNRGVVHIGVSYNDDIEKVETIVNEVGTELFAETEWAEKLLEAPSFVGVTALADSSVNVRIVAKCQPGTQWGIERELMRRLKVAFDARGIEIPFPQRVVHTQPQQSAS